MYKFPNLAEALTYHTHCPLCKRHMRINTRDIMEADDVYLQHRLSFELSWNSDRREHLYIDIPTERVTVEVTHYREELAFGTVSSAYSKFGKSFSTLMMGGKLYQGVTLECPKCCKYSYTLQIIINLDLKRPRVMEVLLNSESISLEDNYKVHEIKNVYNLEKTEYSVFTDNSDKCINLPLIPLNVNQPQETLDRIKKLVIFS
jgi:hypothetical protein